MIGIFAAVMGTTLPFLGSFRETETLETEVQSMVHTLRRAQSRAANGRRDTSWGVQITSDTYVMFAGNSYASRNTALDETQELTLAYTSTGSGEVVFTYQEGTPVKPATFVLYNPSAGTGTITVNGGGGISYDLLRITNQP